VKPGIAVSDYDFAAPHHGLALIDDGETLCIAGRASDYTALVSAPELKEGAGGHFVACHLA